MVYLQGWHGWRHNKLLPSRHILCTQTMHHVTWCKATYARCTFSTFSSQPESLTGVPFNKTEQAIDDLRKSRGLHSVSAYRHGLYIYRSMPAGVARSSHALVGGTVSTWGRWWIPVNKSRKGIINADQALTVRGEHADRIVGSPSW